MHVGKYGCELWEQTETTCFQFQIQRHIIRQSMPALGLALKHLFL